MDLCLEIGGMTFKEMLGRMDAEEVGLWLARASRKGPIDRQYRGDLRSAIVASTIANANRSKKSRAFRWQDFMPYLKEQKVPSPLTPDQQFEVLKGILGAKPASKKKPTKALPKKK